MTCSTRFGLALGVGRRRDETNHRLRPVGNGVMATGLDLEGDFKMSEASSVSETINWAIFT